MHILDLNYCSNNNFYFQVYKSRAEIINNYYQFRIKYGIFNTVEFSNKTKCQRIYLSNFLEPIE